MKLFVIQFLFLPMYCYSNCGESLLIDNPGEYVLSRDCSYNGGVKISSSNVDLNCNGNMLNGYGKSGVGILVSGSKGSIKNIRIENCAVKNFRFNGVRITSGKDFSEWSGIVEKNYKDAPKNITLRNVVIMNSGTVGLYIDSYSQAVKVYSSSIEGSSGVGVYLEQSSRNNVIEDSFISRNGLTGGREGMAIDSSANNLIKNNIFQSNGKGGIFLYKNCGESFPGKQTITRWQHSNNNRMENNVFKDEKVGVWIASRKTMNLSKWGCTDKPYEVNGNFYPDYADYNNLNNNRFYGKGIGVIVEGNNNVISGGFYSPTLKNSVLIKNDEVRRLTGSEINGNIVAE